MIPREKANAASTPLRHDSHGNVVCRQCGQVVQPPRETFCSRRCVWLWRCDVDADFFRAEVLRIHGRRCAVCGICEPVPDPRMSASSAEQPRGAFRAPRPVKPLVEFEADHIQPLWAGGTNDLKNGEVLCVACHAEKSRRETAARTRLKLEQDCRTVMENLVDLPCYGEATVRELQGFTNLGAQRVRDCLKDMAARGLVEQRKRGGPWIAVGLADATGAAFTNEEAVRAALDFLNEP